MPVVIVVAVIVLLVLVVIHDLTQRQHAILRNFPIVGHFRYWLEAVGPELRQYIVTDNNEERPFSPDERRWISREIANHCPTGVATQHPWHVRGVDPTLKASRLADYVVTLRKDLLALSRACGVPHPTLITADHLELLDGRFGSRTVAEHFGYDRGFQLPSSVDCDEVRGLMSV